MLSCQSFFQHTDYQLLRWHPKGSSASCFQCIFSCFFSGEMAEGEGIDYPSWKIEWPFHISRSLLAGLHLTDNELVSIRFHVSREKKIKHNFSIQALRFLVTVCYKKNSWKQLHLVESRDLPKRFPVLFPPRWLSQTTATCRRLLCTVNRTVSWNSWSISLVCIYSCFYNFSHN